MALVLDGNGTMTVGNGDITGLATGALPSNVIGAGAVLQVVTGTLSTQTSISSTSLVDTGLSATIAPTSSTSKILVHVCLPWNTDRSGTVRMMGGMSVLRNSTTIWSHGSGQLGTEFGNVSSTSFRWVLNNMVYDSPATTSSTTYKVQAMTETNSFTLCVNNTIATITLMEIAG